MGARQSGASDLRLARLARDRELLERARAAAQVAFEDFGFLPEETSVAITCDGSPCLRPDARVSVTTSIRVRLPYLPAFLGDAVPAAIPVSATHVATVGRFGGS